MRRPSSIAALVLVIVAVALWFGSARLAERYSTPLRGALPLIAGQHAVFTFTPWLTQRHFVEVEFDRALNFPRLQQIVGPVMGEPTSRPTVDVTVEANGQSVPLQPERGTNWGGLVGFRLCSFPAVRGERYTLTANVRSAESDLQQLHSELFVSIDPLTSEGFYFRVLAARGLAMLLLIAAAFSFFLGVAYRRGIHRATDSSTHASESHAKA